MHTTNNVGAQGIFNEEDRAGGNTPLFRATGAGTMEILQPLPASVSGWSTTDARTNQVRGMAVSGALARATERAAQGTLQEMRPARWSVSLSRPALFGPATVTASVFRQGRRVGVIDAEFHQENQVVARSRALYVRPGRTPAGEVWRPGLDLPDPPELDLVPLDGKQRLFNSGQSGWSAQAEDHHNGRRKHLWHRAIPVVEGEKLSPFQMVASLADIASVAVNMGSAGQAFINADIDLILSRLPTSMEIGLTALDRSESDGIAVGTAVVLDRNGPWRSG